MVGLMNEILNGGPQSGMSVATTPAQKKELIKLADKVGFPMFEHVREMCPKHPNISIAYSKIDSTSAVKPDFNNSGWVSFEDFKQLLNDYKK